MNYYQIWCNIKDSSKDVEFAQALRSFLEHLKEQGRIKGFTLSRRKLGFGPPELGEFCITIHCESLAQLDSAFDLVSPRRGEVEDLHRAVYDAVTDVRFALFRDFPDPGREE